MKMFHTEGTGTLGRVKELAEPMGEIKEGLTGAVSDVSGRLADARDSAEDAISESPFRWTLLALGVGVFVGLLLAGARRRG